MNFGLALEGGKAIDNTELLCLRATLSLFCVCECLCSDSIGIAAATAARYHPRSSPFHVRNTVYKYSI